MSYAAAAYASTARTVMTPREAEAAVLIKAARKLQAVQDDWADQSRDLARDLEHALDFNQKVWTILATGATAPENPLPAEIKRNVVGLAIFVFRRMVEASAEPAAEKLSALIAVNRDIAAGLSGR